MSHDATLQMMDEVLHANIFFLIASLATVCFCILVAIALYQLIKILRAIRRIVDRIEAGSEVIAEDVAHVRAFIRSGGVLGQLLQFVSGVKGSRSKRRSRAKETVD